MGEGSHQFLKRLLDLPGPSGFESAPARLWREEAAEFAGQVDADVSGNSYAVINPGSKPRVMLAGHVDEIGLMVTHIDEQGFLYVDGIGGWDPQVLVGQRLRILSRGGEVPGVVGKKPIHLTERDELDKAVKLKDLWVDVGASDRDAAVGMDLRVGDPAVIDAGPLMLAGDLMASRSVDNRIGAFVVLEALRLLAGREVGAEVTAVATAQEEIGRMGGGAQTGAYRLRPDVAIVVDVTFATDVPGVEKKEVGEHKLGGGPVLSRGSAVHPLVFELLAETAAQESIPVSIAASPRHTATDADVIYLSRAGVPTGLVSVPNRYMHSPNEMVSLRDLDAAARLIAAFVGRLGAEPDFVSR